MDVVEHEQGAVVIPGSETRTMRVHFANKDRYEKALQYLNSVGELKEASCSYEIDVVHYNGSQETLRRTFECIASAGEYFGLNTKQSVKF